MFSLVRSCLLALVASFMPPDQPSVDANPLGWEWAAAPRTIENLPLTWVSQDVSVTLARLQDGKLFASLSKAGGMELAGPQTTYRLVLQDERGGRTEVTHQSSSSSKQITVMRFMLPATERAPVKIGVEVMRPEGRRLVSRAAIDKAVDDGVDVLPMPEVGKPLSFELVDLNGKSLRSQDLKGKLVLIDFWATWCGPCMAKMPQLKKLYDAWHGQGLEVIGISYDRSKEECVKTASEKQLDWHLVHVPEEEGVRDLWERASGVSVLPRLFLLDRDGIVREDFYPSDLEATLRPYLPGK